MTQHPLIVLLSLIIYPITALKTMIVFSFQNPQVALFATIGGLIPSVVWLLFWLQEDRLHPEPKKVILRSFFSGMIAVILSIALQHAFSGLGFMDNTLITFLLFALIEEVFKYWAAYLSCLKSRYADEPIDPVMYLISSALGFAALENIFFLNTPLLEMSPWNSVITGDLRFIGANLLHVISSAIIGLAIAFPFYKDKLTKRVYLAGGIILAVLLHAFFNFFIINNRGNNLIFVFGLIWLFVILLILALEKIKNIKQTKS